MSRNPVARSLRAKPQQVIPDKRESIKRDLRQLYDSAIEEGLPPEWDALLKKLK